MHPMCKHAQLTWHTTLNRRRPKDCTLINLLSPPSRFTKNLSPEQISLSALRGSGELQDLTLDEELLTDLLELPGWVKLTSAKCNRASFRIQWTKLKTVPIVLLGLLGHEDDATSKTLQSAKPHIEVKKS
ncbi:hypothetical protein HF086_001540 [Spodoptera exigua]|uniref:Uncharacterized protein n=1 Tax=Spodoptera exigua TaxID=7107 RepID=A0A922SLR1_SPOEX|nr:hypothetical protein HF086_001540 [Spodoptera exigua]